MNVSAANFNTNTDNQVNINSIATAKVNAGATAAQTERLFENVSVGGPMTATRMDETTKAGIMNELDSIREQVQVSAQAAKDSLKALFKKMDGSAPVLMDENGYNINDMEPEEVVNVVERIQIMLATYCDDYNGTISNIDSDKIEAVTGNKASTQQILEKLESAGAPATRENALEIKDALSLAEQIQEFDENAGLYLVANDLELTIDNLFKAGYGAAKMAGSIGMLDQSQWNSLVGQAEKIIANAGMEVSTKTLKYARTLIENNISVDEKHLKMMEKLENFSAKEALGNTDELMDRIIKNILVGGSAKDTVVVGQPDIDVSREVNQVLSNTTFDDVAQLTFEEKPFTIAQLKLMYMRADYNYTLNEETGRIAGERYEQVMTARMYLMSGISIKMPEIAGVTVDRIVDHLAENDELAMPLADTQEKMAVFDVRMAAFRISQSSIFLVAEAVKGDTAVTLGSLAGKVKTAMYTYEAVGTQVRKDLKDSLFKAVSASSESLLDNMDMEDNEENRSAVRILASNNMDVTKENVELIKEQYSEVKRLIDNMKPQTVLNMIRDGLNPMDTDIRVLNDYLEQAGADSKDEKFSRFLYKLDKHKEIEPSERQQFIGIYKMMNIFREDAGKAVGALYNSGAQLTMSNLIAAYNAGKKTGRSAVVDDNTGMAQVTGQVRYFDNLFSAIGVKITPDTLQKTGNKYPTGEESIERFCEKIDEYYDSSVEKQDIQGFTDLIKSRTDEAGINYLLDKNQGITLDNIMAAHELLSQQADSQFLKKIEPKFKVEINRDSLVKAFEDAADAIDGELGSMYEMPDVSFDDFEEIRMQSKQIHLMANLAKRNDYHIPYEQGQGMGMIHLQVVDGQEKGRASVRITRPSGSEAMVEITVSDNKLRLYGIDSTDGTAMKKALESVAASETVEDMDFDEVRVTSGESEAIPNPVLDTDSGEVKNSTLFVIAKEVINCILINA